MNCLVLFSVRYDKLIGFIILVEYRHKTMSGNKDHKNYHQASVINLPFQLA
jgi:hypothetical protein